ncbi:MAG TPA: bacillithiol biosynthesis cysteine-adding enzyme BshC [Terriglobales bacterium]|nr:bacillithiol biosynthesis cysteine-adding enzyme BshC [Terriglobales bacterium]
MDSQCLSFREVPGTSLLFLDFLSSNPQVRPFYPTSTYSLDELAAHARKIDVPLDRRQLVASILEKQNRGWNAAPEALANIQKFRRGACAVVTGQQVGLFLGPSYTIYKAVTAIRLARELNARGVDTVPVFWLASEDHDLAEVNHVVVPDGERGLQRLETASHGSESAPVGSIRFDSDISSLVENLKSLSGDSEVFNFVRAAYRPGQTFAGAFAELMVKLFSQHGLILLEPSDQEVHSISAPLMQRSAQEVESLTRALLDRGKELEAAGYHAQVKVTNTSTLLFYLRNGARVPVHRKNGHFSANGEHWSVEELEGKIVENAELFTANVLLRPVLQDYLLPTATYIAGPAETAYFAQVQVVYEHLLGRSTTVFPRFSATLIDARLANWMRKYGLRLRDVLQPKDDFFALLSRRTIPADIKEDFDRSREQLERLLTPLLHSLKRLDPTLEAAGEVAARKMQYQLEQLEGRAARAYGHREQVLERHVTLLSSMLFPEKELQERRIAGIYFLSKYGTPLIEQLLEQYKPECRDHQIIEFV